MPKVSAVIPTTLDDRRLPFIRAALDSVLGQHFDDFEVVLVHNGSGQERKHLVAEYLPRVRYVYSPVGNIGDARNRGIAEACGQYVAFLDDDDLWDEHKLRIQSDAMGANPDVDVMFTDTELFDDSGVVHSSYIRHVGGLETLAREQRGGGVYVQSGNWFEYLIRNCPFLPSCWMGKREVLARMPFARTLSEDRELLWRLSRRHTLGFVDQVLTRKRDHGSNISALDLEACMAGVVESSRQAAAWQLSKHERGLLRVWEADARFELGYRCRQRGHHLAAIRHQLASFALAPRLPTAKEVVKNVVLWRGLESSPG